MDPRSKGAVVALKALVVVALVLAVGLAVYAKRDTGSQGPSAAERIAASPGTDASGKPSTATLAGASETADKAPSAHTKVPRLVDLGADKCIPCKMMAPVLRELKAEYEGRLQVDFIDVWKNPDAKKQYSINLIPTQIFYDTTGKELFRHEGFYSKEDILAQWGKLGVDLSVKKQRQP